MKNFFNSSISPVSYSWLSFKTHPFHMVDQSPWPLLGALNSLLMVSGLVSMFFYKSVILFMYGVGGVLVIFFVWCRDVSREGSFQGKHTMPVMSVIRMGMIMFIISEVFFFFSFFWSFFDYSLSLDSELGLLWPPKGLVSFSYSEIPLLNTIILLSSGVSVTWCHYSLLSSDLDGGLGAIVLTVILGVYFSIMQYYEYGCSFFNISDSTFGSIFFVLTGFHGLHVLVGTLFLFVSGFRMVVCLNSSDHHVGFEMASWYWHFVDLVWLFLYVFLYWWGS